jgi:hypothetical protein
MVEFSDGIVFSCTDTSINELKSNNMIRSILILLTVLSTLLLTGAGYEHVTKNDKKACRGYSVIEVNKGVDCYGDTIRLVKVNGYFERVL